MQARASSVLAFLALSLLTLLALAQASRAQDRPLLVFAAASLADVLEEVAALHETRTGQAVRISAGGSGTLARQILAGAPADIFVSANAEWMAEVAARNPVAAASRVDLLGNRLVVIGAVGTDDLMLADLPATLGNGRLALALPEAVPAGRYAQQALEHLGLWDDLQSRLAPADDVRGALVFVATGAAPFGIVYATDAVADARVTVVAEIPAATHAPIIYPAAMVSDAPGTSAFMATLQGAEAAALFEAAGFAVFAR